MMNERKEGPRPRRRRSDAEKLRIVEETQAAGASVSVVARRHDVNANQVFLWRRQYLNGELGGEPGLVPVGVIGGSGRVYSLTEPAVGSPAPQIEPAVDAPNPSRLASPNHIEFDLRGGSRIRMEAGVDDGVLQQVLALIERLA